MTPVHHPVQRVQHGTELEDEHAYPTRVQRLGGHEARRHEGEEEVKEGDHVGRDEVEDGAEARDGVEVLHGRRRHVLARVVIHQGLHRQVSAKTHGTLGLVG